MDDLYFAKPLGKHQVDQAFPLIQTVAPALDIDRWRRFAAVWIEDPARRRTAGDRTAAGIMTVQSERGYIHGLFTYMVTEHLRHGRTLEADNFIVVDLFNTAGAAGALLRAMDQLARTLGCQAIHTNLPERYVDRLDGQVIGLGRSPTVGCFGSAGHRIETVRLCKQLDGANDNTGLGVANDAD